MLRLDAGCPAVREKLEVREKSGKFKNVREVLKCQGKVREVWKMSGNFFFFFLTKKYILAKGKGHLFYWKRPFFLTEKSIFF